MIQCLVLRMVLSLWDKESYAAMYFCLFMALVITRTSGYVIASHGDANGDMIEMTGKFNHSLDHLYFESLSVQGENAGDKLSRNKRDLAWSDIEKFYEDKNNFAMYLVLPLIVLVYGGCAVIYCIARLRRFLKNKKKKPNQQDFSDDAVNTQQNGAVPPNNQQPTISTISNNNNNSKPNSMQREGAKSSSDVNLSLDHSETPLPWQVPDEKEPLCPKGTAMNAAARAAVVAAVVVNTKKQQQPLPQNEYINKGFDDETTHPSPNPPPYEARPVSKPPPYRRESVDEVIKLDESEPQNRDRKRKLPSSRSENVSSPQDNDPRERARRLVRGDNPRSLPPDSNSELLSRKSPTPTFNLQTRALSPKYQPPKDDTSFDSVAMAKQAAELLRLDHNVNKGGGKKTKRLVFVAE